MEVKTILITGATDGIGKQTAIDLAKLGHKVLIHGRNEPSAQKSMVEILNLVPDANLEPFAADLSSLEEINNLVLAISKKNAFLDVLINNAGVFTVNRQVSRDGFEMSFAVNFLAPFFLSHLLLPLLNVHSSSRIVNVSSVAHKRGRLVLEDLQSEQSFDNYKAYADSKLMLIYLTYELADRLAVENITVNALHPGTITTKLLINGFNMQGEDLEIGAETPVYLAVSPEVEHVTGKYFDKRRDVTSSRLSYDQTIRRELMSYTQSLIMQKEYII